MELQTINELTKDMIIHLCEKDKEALYRYASKVEDGGVIVDIGTASGGSAFIMAMASKPNVKIITIDPSKHNDLEYHIDRLELRKKVTFVNSTSLEAFKNWDGRKVDLLFVDGVHSEKGVLDDLTTWGSILKKDGIICIHDIFLYDNTIGALVNTLVNNHELKPLEVVDDTWDNGKRIGMFIGGKYA